MKHRFLPELPVYSQCISCGYVDEVPDTIPATCSGCGQTLSSGYIWFPDTVYEYVILLKDYDARPPTEFRAEYFEAQAEDNVMEYFTSTTEPEFNPTSDWKPVTILLFRSLFELLLEHFLWKVTWIHCLPSPDAEKFADYVLDSEWRVSARLAKVYSTVTNHKWREDITQLGYQQLDKLLQETAKVRNDFVHGNPLAGHATPELPNRVVQAIPELFSLFVKLANMHFHPRALQLRDLRIETMHTNTAG